MNVKMAALPCSFLTSKGLFSSHLKQKWKLHLSDRKKAAISTSCLPKEVTPVTSKGIHIIPSREKSKTTANPRSMTTRRKKTKKPKPTRKAKWIIEQFCDASLPLTGEEVHSILTNWKKAVKPKRPDWLSLLKALDDWNTLMQIYDFVLLEESFEANVQDYTKLMVAYLKLGRYEDVEKTLEVMVERSLSPDLPALTVLLDMYGKSGKLDKMKRVLNDIYISGMKPDAITYQSLMEAYCLCGQPGEAEKVFKEVEAEGLKKRMDMYIHLLRGYGRLGQAEEANRVFMLMQLSGFYPNKKAYSALLDAYTQGGDFEGAALVLKSLLSEGFKPNDRSLMNLMLALEEKGMLEIALCVLGQLESKAIRPEADCISVLAEWLGRVGLNDEAKLLSDSFQSSFAH